MVGKVEIQKQKGLLHIWAREVEGCEAIGEYLMNEMEEDVNKQDSDGMIYVKQYLLNWHYDVDDVDVDIDVDVDVDVDVDIDIDIDIDVDDNADYE